MSTTGQVITAFLQHVANAGGEFSAKRAQMRARCEYLLRGISQDIAHAVPGPWWWMYVSGSVAITAGDGYGYLPSDFGNIGSKGRVYLHGRKKELTPKDAARLTNSVQLDGTTSSEPDAYSLSGQDAGGRRKIHVFPLNSGAITLDIEDYVARAPVLVDFPCAKTTSGAPTAAAGSATGLTGAYSYVMTYETADGETEAGYPVAITVTATKVNLYDLPVPTTPSVTARRLYRTEAGGTTYYRHPQVLDLTTPYTSSVPLVDSTADGSLDTGVSPPDPVDARTGMERFPADWHESLIFNELMGRFMETSGDGRKARKDVEFIQRLRLMWANESSTQNRVQRTPRYGARSLMRRA